MSLMHLLSSADAGSVARGRDYAQRGLVQIRTTGPDGVTAEAFGSTVYDVGIDARGWSCTCPIGLQGRFCKHLVATVLTAAGEVEAAAPDVEGRSRRPAVDAASLRPAVDGLRVRGFLEWRRADEHGERAHAVVDDIEASLTPMSAPELLPLIERAIDLMIKAILRSDDSSGIQGDATARLLRLHVDAAAWARPDPAKLARWMTKVGFGADGFFAIDPVDYAETLGPRGLTAYSKEVDKRLAEKPDDFYPRLAKQRLAVWARDVPAIIDLVGGELGGAWRYRELVDALLEVGEDEKALGYALEGVTVRPVEHLTAPLYDTAAKLLEARGDAAQVLALRRQQLDTFPTRASYSAVRSAAQATGDWDTERLAALDVLLERNPPDYLATLLSEGADDLAWEVSRTLSIPASLRLQLLRSRARTHPADVVEGFTRLINDELKTADQQKYRQAVAYLGELRRAAQAAGQDAAYTDLVTDLLEKYARRPTLVAMLRRMPPT